jgi:hypothetical protein
VVFLNPEVPRWSPSTEEDIRRATNDGVLEESHWWDAKREVSAGKSANKRLAADLAAFAVDGGSLLIGLAEDKETGTFSLAPQPTAQMAERIGSIAATAVDPPLDVVVTAIPATTPAEDGSAQGYLVVEVPPSPRAPHQVDGVYWGRGDKQNIRLSDADVQRHIARRQSLVDRGQVLLAAEVARDPIPTDRRGGGHIYLIAEPLSAAPDAATEFLQDPSARAWALRVSNEEPPELPQTLRNAIPGLQHLTSVEARSDGLGVTSPVLQGTGRQLPPSAPDANRAEADPYRGNVDDFLLDIEYLFGGGIRVLVGRGTWTHPRDSTGYAEDALVVAYARRLLTWLTAFGDAISYRGSWLVGVHADQLAGLTSAAFVDRYSPSLPPRYSAPTYERVTTATLHELLTKPGEVTSRLARSLTWSLGTAVSYESVFTGPIAEAEI